MSISARLIRKIGLGFILMIAALYSVSPRCAIAQTREQERFANMEAAVPSDPRGRFYALSDLASAALNAGEMDKAQKYADELLADAVKYQRDWNYGNAIFHGNMIDGLVALKRDN